MIRTCTLCVSAKRCRVERHKGADILSGTSVVDKDTTQRFIVDKIVGEDIDRFYQLLLTHFSRQTIAFYLPKLLKYD